MTRARVSQLELPAPAVVVGKVPGWRRDAIEAWAAERDARARASGDRRYAANRMSLAEAEARAAQASD